MTGKTLDQGQRFSRVTPPNTVLEPTAAPLLRSTVAAVRTRVVRSTVPARGCGSAWVRLADRRHVATR
jgi:hypothetical protein